MAFRAIKLDILGICLMHCWQNSLSICSFYITRDQLECPTVLITNSKHLGENVCHGITPSHSVPTLSDHDAIASLFIAPLGYIQMPMPWSGDI